MTFLKNRPWWPVMMFSVYKCGLWNIEPVNHNHKRLIRWPRARGNVAPVAMTHCLRGRPHACKTCKMVKPKESLIDYSEFALRDTACCRDLGCVESCSNVQCSLCGHIYHWKLCLKWLTNDKSVTTLRQGTRGESQLRGKVKTAV